MDIHQNPKIFVPDLRKYKVALNSGVEPALNHPGVVLYHDLRRAARTARVQHNDCAHHDIDDRHAQD